VNWDDLRFVLAVSRSRTLSGAARALSVEHSTVGRRLASIEAALAVRLFDRTPEGYLATAVGEAVLAHARAMEENALAIEGVVAEGDSRVAGTVRISALDGFVHHFLSPAIPELRARHPALQIVAAPEARKASLARREADIAIRWRPAEDPRLVSRPLADIGSAIYASRSYIAHNGHPRDPRDLDGHERVGYAPELGHASEERWLEEHAPGARVVLRVGTTAAYLAALEAGVGIGIYECQSADRSAGLVRLWEEPVLMEQWWTVVHVDLARAARIRMVLGFLGELAEREGNRLAGRLEHAPMGE
jgi:DNA-binding transcriptional LysR family regulator